MKSYLEKLKKYNKQIEEGFYNNGKIPTLEEEIELLKIAKTCFSLSNMVTNLKKIDKEIFGKENI